MKHHLDSILSPAPPDPQLPEEIPYVLDSANDTILINQLSSVYRSRSIVNVLLPLAAYLGSNISNHWSFYTDSAFFRTYEVTTLHSNGSGIVVSLDNLSAIPDFQLSFTSSFW